MGKSYKDVKDHTALFAYKVFDNDTDELVKVQIGDKFYSPIELSSYILKELKNRAEHLLKTPVNKAVITVPAYFNDAQRQATRDAGRLAGLDVLRIVNEPTAASLAYGIGINSNEERIIAVYDLGGGTFDISILRITNGIFEVLSTNGDTYLGGDDIDRAIVEHWIAELGLNEQVQNNKQLVQAIRLLAEDAKKHLSTHDSFEGIIASKSVVLHKGAFNELIQALVDRTVNACKGALKDANLTTKDIDAVVMVGGSTRVPHVKESIKEFFGKEVHDDLNPDEVVAFRCCCTGRYISG